MRNRTWIVLAASVLITGAAGCSLFSGGKVTPEAVAAVQAQQAALKAQIDKQAADAQAQLEAARASNDPTKIKTAELNMKLVSKASEYITKGTTAVNLILQPDGTIDITPAAGLLAAIPGWGPPAALVASIGGVLLREFQQRRRLASAQSNTEAAHEALSALWNATPEGPGPSDSLPPAILSTIHKVDAAASAA